MTWKITLDEAGAVTGVFPPDDPFEREGAIEVDDAQAGAIVNSPDASAWHYDGVAWIEPDWPPVPPAPPVAIAASIFFERTTAAEADAIDEAMTAKSVPTKIRKAYQAASLREFREGTDVWAALWAAIVGLFGETRPGELLVT